MNDLREILKYKLEVDDLQCISMPSDIKSLCIRDMSFSTTTT